MRRVVVAGTGTMEMSPKLILLLLIQVQQVIKLCSYDTHCKVKVNYYYLKLQS